jgi:hypothetical protein
MSHCYQCGCIMGPDSEPLPYRNDDPERCSLCGSRLHEQIEAPKLTLRRIAAGVYRNDAEDIRVFHQPWVSREPWVMRWDTLHGQPCERRFSRLAEAEAAIADIDKGAPF